MRRFYPGDRLFTTGGINPRTDYTTDQTSARIWLRCNPIRFDEIRGKKW